MIPGSFEDNDRLRAEMTKLISKDLKQILEIDRLHAELTELQDALYEERLARLDLIATKAAIARVRAIRPIHMGQGNWMINVKDILRALDKGAP